MDRAHLMLVEVSFAQGRLLVAFRALATSHRFWFRLKAGHMLFDSLLLLRAFRSMEQCTGLSAASATTGVTETLQTLGRRPRAGLPDVNLLLEGLEDVPEADENLLMAQVKDVHRNADFTVLRAFLSTEALP